MPSRSGNLLAAYRQPFTEAKICVMGREVLRWLIFSVLVGLIAPAMNGVLALVSSKTPDYSLLWDGSVLFGRGELLMVSVGLSATIVGDAVVAEGPRGVFKTLAVGMSFVVGVFTAGVYGIVLALQDVGSDILGDAVAVVSLAPYTVMVLLSGVSIIRARRLT
jgi:hypothetical protein